MYHGVNASGDTSINGRHLSAKRFDRHLKYLKKHFEILTLSDAFNEIGKPSNGKPRACITFDDGFENNLQYAAPLLKKHEVPATFYVSSVCVTEETDILWPDVVDLIARNRASVEASGLEFSRVNGFMNEEIGMRLQDFIKAQDCEKRDEIILELSDRYDLLKQKKEVNSESWKLMTSAQVKQLSEFPQVEIGSHCHNHYNLASLSEANSQRELVQSKKLLEGCIGQEVKTVAFPDGSYDARVKAQAYEADYSQLCAVSFKLTDDENDNRIVKRSAVSSTTNYYSNVIHFHKHFEKDGN